MLISRRSRIWSGFLLAALLLSLLGTVATPSPTRAASAPPEHIDEFGTPLAVEVTLAELPTVGKTTEGTIVVSSSEPAAGVRVEVIGSDGLRIEAARETVIDLRAGESHTLAISVTPDAPGNHSVEANVSLDVGEGTVWGDSDGVYFYSDVDTASEGYTYQGHPTAGPAAPGPGNTMKFTSEAYPDGSMPAVSLDEGMELPVDTGEPGGQAEIVGEGEVAMAAGDLTIRGNVGMTDRNGNWKNQKLLVSLVTSNGAVWQWTFSDANGDFVFNISNPGVFRIRVWANYRHSSMQIGAIRVVGNGLQTLNRFSIAGWHYNLPAMGPFPNGEVNVGTWQPDPAWDGHRAWWVFQDLMDGFVSTWNQTPPGLPAGSRQPDGVTVEWEPGSKVGNFYRPTERRVHLADNAANSDSVALHEYGHAIMHNVYGFFPINDCPDPHRVEKASTARCAWIEGWAGFFSSYVRWDPVLMSPCALPCDAAGTLNYEERYTPAVPWNGGDLVEGNVTAALWDFVDAWGDGYEKTNSAITPFSKIWDVVYTQNHLTFSEFWSMWSGNVDFANSLATLYQNTIDYGWSSYCPDYLVENDDNVLEVPVNADPAHPPYQRAFCTSNDWDWYKFVAEAGKTYTIETSNLGTAIDGTIADTTLTLFRPEAHGATQLAFDNNNGSEHLASRIVYTAPTSGELHLAVRNVETNGNPGYLYTIDFTETNANAAPTVTAPTHKLYAGSTLGNPATDVYTVDVRADWTAEDPDDGIAFQSLQGQVDEAGFTMLEPSLAGDARSHNVPLTIDTANQLQVSATDSYGASSGYASGEGFALVGAQERDFTVEGQWTNQDAEAAWGGSYMSTNGEASPMIAGASSTPDGAYATVSFTGSSVALVGMTAPDGGYAEVYIDGELHGRADFYAERELHRQVVFAVNGLSAGAHHTLDVRWIPSSNELSSGTQLYLDGVIALD